ncbi:MAG: hypothetical protein R6V59_03225 [Dehalococcoidia bacterium]
MAEPFYITKFDSSWGMLKALSRFLEGKDFPGVGILPTARPVEGVVDLLRGRAITTAYTYGGAMETVPPAKLADVRAEKLAARMVEQYPRGKYKAAMLGSSNGAAVHLCAALGIPWLPQTFLMAIRRPGLHPDQVIEDMEWGKATAEPLLRTNPEFKLHQMHDPCQDRLMIQRMAYFRIKRLRLGETFERFLKENLEPGATIFVLECTLSWPTTEISPRHVFQVGGVGGITPEEYINGSEKVTEFLKREGVSYTHWDVPEPDARRPEAEWGFEPALLEDVYRFAAENNYRVKRISFVEPEHLSPLVADLYRWWHEKRGISSNRLLVQTFNVVEPWWTLKTGSVPFWIVFNTEPSAASVEGYLEQTPPFDYIHLMILSHGVHGPGVTPIERWRSILHQAGKDGSFIGLKEEKYPQDIAVFIRYNREVQKLPGRYDMPAPMELDQLDTFVKESGHRYQVQWV